ncbi:MAG: SDR family NAD(P)-dependent oxidoreductase [Alphaproteobacteria bacterium]
MAPISERPISERVVMVSGAARGLGRAIAARLYADGYTLSLGARDPRALESAHAAMDRARVLFHRHDAMDAKTGEAWVGATVARFGRIDGLVNNAGLLRQFTVEEADGEALDAMWAVNAKGPMLLARAAFPYLKKSGAGRVVNVSSLSGLRVRRLDFVGYSMTKFALVALTHAIRQEGWEHGIRATAFCPSIIETEMSAGLGFPKGQALSPETAADLVATVLSLPNTASIAELPVNVFAEPNY